MKQYGIAVRISVPVSTLLLALLGFIWLQGTGEGAGVVFIGVLGICLAAMVGWGVVGAFCVDFRVRRFLSLVGVHLAAATAVASLFLYSGDMETVGWAWLVASGVALFNVPLLWLLGVWRNADLWSDAPTKVR